MKRTGAKDGSVPVQTKCYVNPDKTENEVLKDCLEYLKQKHVFHNRHDVGSANIAGAGFAVYGIKDAGDIIGILADGTHFEIETKRGKGGRWSEGQQKRCNKILETNGVYLLVSGVEELKRYYSYFGYFNKNYGKVLK